MRPDPESLENARRVTRAHAQGLLAKANVVGVGVGLRGEGQLALVVMVTRKLPAELLPAADLLPTEVEGLPVEVRVVGELKADQTNPVAKG